MNQPPVPDLIKVTEIFLVPSSFLVAALGTADTNPHRALVSLLGFVISLFWWICSREALAEHGPETVQMRRTQILAWLSLVFLAGWLASTVGHVVLWSQPLGQ